MDSGYRKDSERLARALSLAIAQPTVSGGDKAPFLRLHALLRELFPRLFAVASLQPAADGALLFCLKGERVTRPLLFLSHLDVVPADDLAAWRHPPFSGTVADGFVYGRGAADMKGHMIALLSAAEGLLAAGWQPKGDIWFAFSCDEEIRGPSMAGMARIMVGQGVRPSFILDEGGAVTDLLDTERAPYAFVGIAEKGRLNFSLSISGPRAAERLAKAACRIARIRMRPRLCAETQMTLQSLADGMKGFDRFCALHLPLCARPLLAKAGRTAAGQAITRTQLYLRQLKGDAMLGVSPAFSYQATILPGDSAEKLLSRARGAVRDPDILFSVHSMEEPGKTSPVNGMAWDALATAIHVHFPHIGIAPFLLAGGTDARRVEGLSPCVYRFSPFLMPKDELARVHNANERISIENMVRAEGFFRQMLQA